MQVLADNRTSGVTIEDVVIRYETHDGAGLVAVDGVDFTVGQGEFVALVGPSGCGKSSLLMAIAGLVPIDGGGSPFHDRPRQPARTRRRSVSCSSRIGSSLG